MARPAISRARKPSRGKWPPSPGSRTGSAGSIPTTASRSRRALDWDDHVLVVTANRARGRAGGVPIARQTAQLMTLRDGKIVRQDFFASRAEALEAAGLTE